MREINLRAWDKWNKRMVQIEDLSRNIPSNYKDCFILLQQTGLSDRLGNYIYEGDIVGIATEKMDIIGEVCFSDGAFWVKGMLLFDFKKRDSLIEVLGNIYQHSELIKEESL